MVLSVWETWNVDSAIFSTKNVVYGVVFLTGSNTNSSKRELRPNTPANVSTRDFAGSDVTYRLGNM